MCPLMRWILPQSDSVYFFHHHLSFSSFPIYPETTMTMQTQNDTPNSHSLSLSSFLQTYLSISLSFHSSLIYFQTLSVLTLSYPLSKNIFLLFLLLLQHVEEERIQESSFSLWLEEKTAQAFDWRKIFFQSLLYFSLFN